MERLLKAEIIKLRSLKLWWLVIAGGVLPVVITYLTVYNQENVTMQTFVHTSVLTFNIQALLTYATFATYIWARENEEHMMEIVLCYSYPAMWLVSAKLIVMIFIILSANMLFLLSLFCGNLIMFGNRMQIDMLSLIIKALLNSASMNFLLVPLYLGIAVITKLPISGLIFGIINMSICMVFGSTKMIQYIPQCIPYLIGDKILELNSILLSHSRWVYYLILSVVFLAGVIVDKIMIDKKVCV